MRSMLSVNETSYYLKKAFRLNYLQEASLPKRSPKASSKERETWSKKRCSPYDLNRRAKT